MEARKQPTGEAGRTRPPGRILATCFSSTAALGTALRQFLEPAWGEELGLGTLPEDAHGCAATLAGLLVKRQPTLLLVCLPREDPAIADAVFAAISNSRRELVVLPVLEPVPAERLQQLIEMGAADFCLAPLRPEDLLPRVLRWSAVIPANVPLSRRLERGLGLERFLGESPVFLEAIRKIPKLARCDASVLISGETGTGKEMCARAIHHLGPRADHPFVPVNCGAIPAELVENELFGHDAGAFTSAASSVHGLVHEAEGGTLFLDEVDALPSSTQVKFLRFLQDQQYRPLGAKKLFQADLRVIAACNANLEEFVRSRKFRADLFYRLNVLPLALPALRDRREDIPLLARHFASKFAAASATTVKEFSRTAIEKLSSYDWPGNVRELENIIERAVVLTEQPVITGEDICLPGTVTRPELSFKELKRRVIVEFETNYIRQLLSDNDGNISQAARVAKKSRRAFWQLMRKHEIAVSAAAMAQ